MNPLTCLRSMQSPLSFSSDIVYFGNGESLSVGTVMVVKIEVYRDVLGSHRHAIVALLGQLCSVDLNTDAD
jgi:hypothetical protein